MVRQSGCDPLCDPADPAGSCCLSDCGIKKKQKKKELEQQDELHKALIAADTANRAKSTFLLNMSHDIRTPLNGIMGLLKINMAHSDDEELVRENYKEMEKAANHLLSLINDVLQMSKLEDGREELSSELVCLPDVFYDMKAIMDGSALDKGISVDFSEDSIWVHPYVITNPLYLRQIFLNRLHKKELMPGAIIMELDLAWLL